MKIETRAEILDILKLPQREYLAAVAPEAKRCTASRTATA